MRSPLFATNYFAPKLTLELYHSPEFITIAPYTKTSYCLYNNEVLKLYLKDGDSMVVTMGVLFKAIVLMILLFVILLLSIWYSIRKKRNRMTFYVYIFSSLSLALCSFGILSTTNFNPSLEPFFLHAFRILWILFGVTTLVFIFEFSRLYLLTTNHSNASPDVQTVFYSIQDLALITNHNGDIIEINHPKNFKKTFGSINCLKDLLDAIQMDSLPETYCEITYKGLSYYINIIPIVSHRFFVGHALIFYDITALKSIETTLRHQKKILEDAHEKLQREVKLVNSLNTENLRLQQIQSIQDALVNDLQSALNELNTILDSNYKHSEIYHQKVTDFSNTLRHIYAKLRTFVHKIFTKQGEKI